MSDVTGIFIAGMLIVVFGLAILAEIVLEKFYGE